MFSQEKYTNYSLSHTHQRKCLKKDPGQGIHLKQTNGRTSLGRSWVEGEIVHMALERSHAKQRAVPDKGENVDEPSGRAEGFAS